MGWESGPTAGIVHTMTRGAEGPGRQLGRPAEAGAAVAAIGAVIGMVALVHLTCTPGTSVSGPTASTEKYAHQTGVISLPYRGSTLLLETRR